MPFGALSIKPQRPKLEDTEPQNICAKLVDAITLRVVGAGASPTQRLRLLGHMESCGERPDRHSGLSEPPGSFLDSGGVQYPWDQNPPGGGGGRAQNPFAMTLLLTETLTPIA